MYRPVVLHVEDDDNDAFFVSIAFAKANLGCELQCLSDGQQAINWLSQANTPGNGTCETSPAMILLDLKLPFLDGFEVLTWIRRQARYQHLPVAVLSGSFLEEDRSKALGLGADEYFVKGDSYADLVGYVARTLAKKTSVPGLRAPAEHGQTANC